MDYDRFYTSVYNRIEAPPSIIKLDPVINLLEMT